MLVQWTGSEKLAINILPFLIASTNKLFDGPIQ
ncbi:hypothetical protein LIMNO130_30213 [Limnobacter sp. 130]|nr:hypothetical protein LIMNO130_30213 [Limnobacter sp. 130]